MNRIVSFGLLLAVILITGFVFFKVMAGFFLPLFLAALLVVLFRPLHEWILKKVKGRPKLGAFLSTAAILLIVLLPFTITFIFAANEGRSVIRKMDPSTMMDKFRLVRAKLGLEMPAPGDFERMDTVINAIQDQSIAQNIEQQREQIDYDITELRGLSVDLGVSLSDEGFELKWTEKSVPEPGSGSEDSGEFLPTSLDQEMWQTYARELAESRQMLSDEAWAELADVDAQQKQLSDARKKFNTAIDSFYQFKSQFLGGPMRSWIIEMTNPDPDELNAYIEKGTSWLRRKMVSYGGATTTFLGRFVFGVIVLTLALFSFLLDGPAMLKALKQLSPLDDQYEDELITEFDNVSRAVVMATLLSALAQGFLAAIGFYIAGMNSVILLMLLTSVLALVPFVGAAAVWVPVSLWLIFVEGHVGSGIFLAVYGTLVVSMSDNVIKPLILHGQSNLHPLWALLSVLGGVAALGPVGILVGPMVVVFLQSLLKILQREMSAMDRPGSSGPQQSSVSWAMKVADDRASQRRQFKELR